MPPGYDAFGIACPLDADHAGPAAAPVRLEIYHAPFAQHAHQLLVRIPYHLGDMAPDARSAHQRPRFLHLADDISMAQGGLFLVSLTNGNDLLSEPDPACQPLFNH